MPGVILITQKISNNIQTHGKVNTICRSIDKPKYLVRE